MRACWKPSMLPALSTGISNLKTSTCATTAAPCCWILARRDKLWAARLCIRSDRLVTASLLKSTGMVHSGMRYRCWMTTAAASGKSTIACCASTASPAISAWGTGARKYCQSAVTESCCLNTAARRTGKSLNNKVKSICLAKNVFR